jgi:hypothetical protein
MFPKSQALPHQACSRWLIDPPAKPKFLLSKFLNQCLLMLALWGCGRRGSVVQAQRQIHRASRATFTIAETVLRTVAEQTALGGRNARIGGRGSEDHSVRGFSAPLLQATLQCPQLPLRVDAGVLSLQPLQ